MRIAIATLAFLLALPATHAASKKTGGLIGNSYASQFDRIDADTLRITTRKKVTGDINEVNKPGTTMYNALLAVQAGASVRAALEAKNLGYQVFQLQGVRNLTQSLEKRSASVDHGAGPENSYTFAPGHYTTDIEIAIEMTVKLIAGPMPATPPEDYVNVDQMLIQAGLAELVVK
ncbi:MAG: hypothetical protein QM808_06420 [Steroidobacteraceae bacterium]